MENQSSGKVYLVGAGPGDPELLTIKACNLLKQCDVVIRDYLVNPGLLKYAPANAEIFFLGKPRQGDRITQVEVQQLMIRQARQGKRVVRLKGGDPFVFGRGGEEALALSEAGVEWEVVPGVSSGHAVPAYAGIPLTHRDFASSVAFVTGQEQADKSFSVNWRRLATAVDTLVIFMGAANLANIVSALVEAGRPPATPIAVIERGTSAAQLIHRATLVTILHKVVKDEIRTPALIVVGKVVELHEKLSRYSVVPVSETEVLRENLYDEVFSSLS